VCARSSCFPVIYHLKVFFVNVLGNPQEPTRITKNGLNANLFSNVTLGTHIRVVGHMHIEKPSIRNLTNGFWSKLCLGVEIESRPARCSLHASADEICQNCTCYLIAI
jgi:hypothetical protein